MSKRRRKGLAPSLFPFLAVLVCTLGTLILLLAMVAKDAEETVEQVAEQAQEALLREVAEVQQQQRWRREQLQGVRDAQTAVLENRRSELAHVEDHLRRLKQDLKSLQAEVRTAFVDDIDEESLKAEIALAATKIEQDKQDLEKLKTERANQRPRVAIMPHRGPNGTFRRPLYMECTGDAIILQPEGIRVTVDQLRGPSGPGNPLDVALRTIRNYWESKGENAALPPYPLLLVRPDGIVAYTAARVSMTAWDDQFGYELVPAGVELAFPEADDALAERTENAIAEAVQRRAAIVSAVPGRYRRGLSGSDPIGDAIDGIANRDETSLIGRRTKRPATDATGGAGQGGATSPMQRWNQNLDSSLASQSTSASNAYGRGGDGQTNGQPTVFAAGGSHNTSGGSRPQASAYGSQNPADSSRPPGPSQPRENETFHPYSGNPSADGYEIGTLTGGEPGGTLDEGGRTGSETGAYQPGSTSESAGMESGGTSASGGTSQGSAEAMGSAGDSAESPPQNAAISANVPLAGQRGSGWAMRGAGGSSDGPAVVRNLNIECYANRFVLLGDSSNKTEIIIVDPGNPNAAIVQLARRVRERVDNWGIALTGGSWQPMLRVGVAADGNENYETLRVLLDRSGIGITRRNSR